MIYLCGPDRLKRRLLVTPVFPPLLLTSKSVFQPSLVSSLLQCAAQGPFLCGSPRAQGSLCVLFGRSQSIDRGCSSPPGSPGRGMGMAYLPYPCLLTPAPASPLPTREGVQMPNWNVDGSRREQQGICTLKRGVCIAKQKGYHVSCRKRLLKAKSLMPTPTICSVGTHPPRTPIWRENRGLRRTELGERAPPVHWKGWFRR